MLTDVQLMQIKNSIMRVLHIPGNYSGDNLEMAIVADCHIPLAELQEDLKQLANMLKRQDETFRNVRLNLIKWISDEQIIKEVSSLSYLQMGRGFLEDERQSVEENAAEEKSLDELFRQLKLFYARSKVILLITDGSYITKNEDAVKEALRPFLGRKLLILKEGQISKLPMI